MATVDTRGKISPAGKRRSGKLEEALVVKRDTKNRTHPARDDILKYFDYDPETGKLTNRVDRGRARAGQEAGRQISMRHGHVDDRWYRRVGFKGREYLAHVLILVMMGLTIPASMEVDHRNGDGLDNRFENLRIVTHKDNMMNTKRHRAEVGLPAIEDKREDTA